MDSNVLVLAGTAGTTVVSLLATDAWTQARRGVIGLWQRFRPEEADEIAGLLSGSREALLGGADAEDVSNQWQIRLIALLAQHPEAKTGLSDLLIELRTLGTGQAFNGDVHIEGHATNGGQIYQTVRDQTVNNYR
ncbi:hypothetical protein ACIRL0_29455 [Streptomyces sp. NPDC102365]|uniref:hypothetical protein n=1 Tax=Streptomyces sp. NPDC102365 TaxID=3366162 RepID=UPI003823B00E